MNQTVKKIGATASSVAIAAAFCGQTMAFATQADDQAVGQSSYDAINAVGGVQHNDVKLAEVLGQFSFTQDFVSSNEQIANVFKKHVVTMCSSPAAEEPSNIGEWKLTVGGDVDSAFTATLSELSEKGAQTKVMTCACSNNSAGGAAIINARVTGIPISQLALRAGISSDANAVVITASDGMQSTLPLSYVLKHNAMVVYDVNDADLSESVGGTNQLWLESSAGKYFTRDVVNIDFVSVQDAPAEPQFEAGEFEYVNRPNVGIEMNS